MVVKGSMLLIIVVQKWGRIKAW